MKFKDIIPWDNNARKPVVWDPFREMGSLFGDIDGSFASWPTALRSSPALLGGVAGFSPAVDVKESETEFVFSVSVPGVEKSDLNIDLREDQLTIRGERKLDKEYESKEGLHRIEQGYGSFSRTFSLPAAVNTKDAKAAYKDGVLKIRLPKSQESQKRRLEIE